MLRLSVMLLLVASVVAGCAPAQQTGAVYSRNATPHVLQGSPGPGWVAFPVPWSGTYHIPVPAGIAKGSDGNMWAKKEKIF